MQDAILAFDRDTFIKIFDEFGAAVAACNDIAEIFNGGGHKFAAGARLDDSYDISRIESIIIEQGNKISLIEKELLKYQDMINSQSNILDI